MKSFALSRLAQQRLVLGERFGQQFAHDWLVWEPGAWVVPRGTAGGEETMPPKVGLNVKPRIDDPLCFVLAARLDGSGCTIGRAEGNDLVLSDETVSRRHCFFSHTGKTWVVSCDADAKELKVDGKPVKSTESAPIRSGQRIELGHLTFTLLDNAGMLARLDGLPVSKM
ncbi:MAG: FHA domain-containing protein [Myxococcaceae bacterium]|nr:FHA domain-containing protein [Myxococcaceae bacterium]